MATERLYYTDAYLRRFDARVTRRAADGSRVYLDRTALYPTSGGQPHDLGTIGNATVIDVIDEGDEIAHLVAGDVASDDVTCAVDWTRRYDFMQQHTGQHLISAVFADTFGHATVSVHFGDDMSTLDLDVGAVDPALVRDAEARANAIIAENRPVTVSFEDAATAAGLRKPSDRDGTLRIVGIEGTDRSACGGTHVRSTAEIGVLLLRRQERVRKSARIEFVCGLRAGRHARADYEAITGVAHTLSAAPDDVPALVASQLQQLKDAEQARRRLESDVAGYRARERYEGTPANASGVRRYVSVEPNGSLDEFRALAIAMSTMPRAVCLLANSATRSVLLSASEDSGVDAGAAMKQTTSSLGGRGGGSPRLAQGTFPDDGAFARAVQTLGA